MPAKIWDDAKASGRWIVNIGKKLQVVGFHFQWSLRILSRHCLQNHKCRKPKCWRDVTGHYKSLMENLKTWTIRSTRYIFRHCIKFAPNVTLHRTSQSLHVVVAVCRHCYFALVPFSFFGQRAAFAGGGRLAALGCGTSLRIQRTWREFTGKLCCNTVTWRTEKKNKKKKKTKKKKKKKKKETKIRS